MSVRLLLLSLAIASIALGASAAEPTPTEPITSGPVSVPTPIEVAPVSAPHVEPVVATPVEVAPVAAPVVAPVTAPVTEVPAPVIAEPITAPVAVEAPVVAPVPVHEPVVEPVTAPVAATPVSEPVSEPVVVVEPISAPVTEPIAAPVTEPVAEPSSPIAAPVDAPIAAPVAEPLAPTTPLTPVDITPGNNCGTKPTPASDLWVCSSSGVWTYTGTLSVAKGATLETSTSVLISGGLVLAEGAQVSLLEPKTTIQIVNGCVNSGAYTIVINNANKKFNDFSSSSFNSWTAISQPLSCSTTKRGITDASISVKQAESGCKNIEAIILPNNNRVIVGAKVSNYKCNVIIGVAVGLSVLVVILIIALVVICVRQHRKRARVSNGGFPDSPLIYNRR